MGRDTLQDAERVLAGHARWALIHVDCRELLAELPDKNVDPVIPDPQY